MSDHQLDSDELLTLAVSDVAQSATSELSAATEELPPADRIWQTDNPDNVLAVLNNLSENLDAGDAPKHIHEAKKQYVVLAEIDADLEDTDVDYDSLDDLRDAIEAADTTISLIEKADSHVQPLTTSVPELRSSLHSLNSDS